MINVVDTQHGLNAIFPSGYAVGHGVPPRGVGQFLAVYEHMHACCIIGDLGIFLMP